MLDLKKFKVLTFDCYGTLIDWEAGILSAMKPILKNHEIDITDKEILERHAQIESSRQKAGYSHYKEVLRQVVRDFGQYYHFVPSETEQQSLPNSVQFWSPFSDTINALHTLKKFFKLAIISNIDDDLFRGSQKNLLTEFDWIITAEQVKSYKPSLNNFNQAIEKMNIPPSQILHVAQSIYHDIVPANQLGITNVWVNRRMGKDEFGATLPASDTPSLEVPDLQTLASLVEAEFVPVNR